MSTDKNEEKMEPTVEFQFNTAKVKQDTKTKAYSMELIYDKVETDEHGKVSVTPVKEDPPYCPNITLFNALNELVPHMMLDTDFMPLSKVNKEYFKNKEILKDTITNASFKVTGIHVKESKEQRFVVIVGRKILKNGKVINLTPMLNISNHEDGYAFAKELSDSVNNVITEVGLYKEGHHAPKYQMEITDKPKTEKPVAEEKPKKPSSKKNTEEGK